VRRPWRALIGAASALTLVVVPAAAAQADPSVASIEKEISQAWAKAEPLIEQYNKIHESYKKNKAKQQALKKKIDPLQRQIDLSQIRIGVISASAYKGNQANAFNAMLNAGSPGAFADQLSMLDQLAREQQSQIAKVTALKSQYDAERKPIDDLVAKLTAQDKDLAARKKAIDADMLKLQALRAKAYGESGTLGDYRPWTCPAEQLNTAGFKAANFACHQISKPYVWAAAGPDEYDCSGLTMQAWNNAGVGLSHNADDQMHSMPTFGDRSKLAIGDLIFYGADDYAWHVAIYVGGGHMVHAPTSGDVVRMANIDSPGTPLVFGRPNG
jgi:cell wall-associated NlpC family hydrolase